PGHGGNQRLKPARCHGEVPLRGEAVTAPLLARRILNEEEDSRVTGHGIVARRLPAAARTQPEACRLHGEARALLQDYAEDVRSAVSPLVEGPAGSFAAGPPGEVGRKQPRPGRYDLQLRLRQLHVIAGVRNPLGAWRILSAGD